MWLKNQGPSKGLWASGFYWGETVQSGQKIEIENPLQIELQLQGLRLPVCGNLQGQRGEI